MMDSGRSVPEPMIELFSMIKIKVMFIQQEFVRADRFLSKLNHEERRCDAAVHTVGVSRYHDDESSLC